MNPLSLFKYVPLSVLRALAILVAWTINLIPNAPQKRIIDINLHLACPNLDRHSKKTLISQIVRHQALSSAESIKCWAMPPSWSIAQINQVHNLDLLLTALKDPKGMLAVVPHLGTWEIMNAWINQFGSPTIMYKPIQNRLVNDFVLQGRQRLNAQLVPTDARGVKAIYKNLRKGGFSVVLPDHVPKPSGGINAPFFGIDTLTSTLAPKLASKTKCAMVGLVCLRNEKTSANGHNGFDIYCMALDDPLLYDKDIIVAATALNKAIQSMVEQFPEHYMWGYRRFKNIPDIQNPYKASEVELKRFLHNHVNSSHLNSGHLNKSELNDSGVNNSQP